MNVASSLYTLLENALDKGVNIPPEKIRETYETEQAKFLREKHRIDEGSGRRRGSI